MHINCQYFFRKRVALVTKDERRRSRNEWAGFFNEWLAEHVTYQSSTELNNEFSKLFGSIKHIEDDYVTYRLTRKNQSWLSAFFNNFLVRAGSVWLYTRWGGLVLLASKQ